MKNLNDLPIYFIIIGLVLNIILSLYVKVSFNALMLRSIIVIILFGIMGYIIAKVIYSASIDIIKAKYAAKSKAAEEATISSTLDIRAEAEDEDELLRAISQSEDEDFVEIRPEDFKTFMNRE